MSASSHQLLLLDLWREVGRHLEIGEFLEAVAPRIAARIALRGIRIVRLDPLRSRAEVIAAVGPGGRPDPELGGVSDRGVVEGLVADLKPGILPAPERLERSLGPILWPGSRGALWGACLPQGDAAPGLLLVFSGDLGGKGGLLTDLVEPFAAALTNDRRLQELARLREAMEADNRALLRRLERSDISDTVVGEGAGLREVMKRVDQVAPTDAPVLLLGETGSGKEVVARAIHKRSARAAGPFLRVNCGAIPPELIDSELFGHEKGSFTGAVGTRRGWFERADGGTLFLDELGELPPAAQVRLLRVLQDGTFERVRGQRPMRADVRVVAATHRDMHALVVDGVFRQDLWYRVSVFPISLPPLRDRPEDIPELASHFAERAGRRLHGHPLPLSREDIAALLAYDWPGNVRELAAVIERAAILGDGRRLEIRRALGAGGPAPRPEPARPSRPRGATLEEVNRGAIEDALRRAHGQIQGPGGASEILGINPSTLRSRMKRLGVRRDTADLP